MLIAIWARKLFSFRIEAPQILSEIFGGIDDNITANELNRICGTFMNTNPAADTSSRIEFRHFVEFVFGFLRISELKGIHGATL
jgi:hypothetical protein